MRRLSLLMSVEVVEVLANTVGQYRSANVACNDVYWTRTSRNYISKNFAPIYDPPHNILQDLDSSSSYVVDITQIYDMVPYLVHISNVVPYLVPALLAQTRSGSRLDDAPKSARRDPYLDQI